VVYNGEGVTSTSDFERPGAEMYRAPSWFAGRLGPSGVFHWQIAALDAEGRTLERTPRRRGRLEQAEGR
jgi:hypothetical protein